MAVRWSIKGTRERLLKNAADGVTRLKAKGIDPHLAVILVGDDPASKVYVRNKVETCGQLDIRSTLLKMPEDTTTEALLEKVDQLNNDHSVHGILVQTPLPKQVDEEAVLYAVDPDKDVDGFHPLNVGRLSIGAPGLFPCTPMGVIETLKDSDIDLKGKHAVVIGRSNIVGKPMAQLLLGENCTVTIVHSRTRNAPEVCKQADIVIAAVGRPGMVDASYLKEGAYVVDVGINEITDPALAERLFKAGGKKIAAFHSSGRAICGDVDYQSAIKVAAKVTPVPGGVGPLTIAHLMVNCIAAAERSAS